MTAVQTSDPHADERRQLQRVREHLVDEFGDRLSGEQVAERFADVVSRFDGAPVRTFVPVLASRAAREDLRRLAGA
jgi:hypothetical protein